MQAYKKYVINFNYSDWSRKTVSSVTIRGLRAHSGLVDQSEDRRLCKAEALGSNPSGSIRIRILKIVYISMHLDV